MGTTWSVRLVAVADLSRERFQHAVQRCLDDVVAQMSTWDETSDLCRFNRAPAGTWQALPPEFFTVLQHACAVAQLSEGAFDPTAGALVDLWGFGPVGRAAPASPAAARKAPEVLPDATRLAEARRRIGWHRLTLDAHSRSAFQPGGLSIDLSAIAKGFAVDQVARRLTALGIDSHLVEVGGELRGSGVKPDGRPWWVALEHPQALALPAATGTHTVIALHGLCVATSGDYRRGFEHEGVRYSHTVDPRDGWPIRHSLASVTVLHADCMSADAWSTALTVLGPRDGLAFAERHGLAALFVLRAREGYEELASTAFEALSR